MLLVVVVLLRFLFFFAPLSSSMHCDTHTRARARGERRYSLLFVVVFFSINSVRSTQLHTNWIICIGPLSWCRLINSNVLTWQNIWRMKKKKRKFIRTIISIKRYQEGLFSEILIEAFLRESWKRSFLVQPISKGFSFTKNSEGSQEKPLQCKCKTTKSDRSCQNACSGAIWMWMNILPLEMIKIRVAAQMFIICNWTKKVNWLIKSYEISFKINFCSFVSFKKFKNPEMGQYPTGNFIE